MHCIEWMKVAKWTKAGKLHTHTYTCVCVGIYTHTYTHICIYKLWWGRREYVYVNICGMRVQIVVHVLQRVAPDRGRWSIVIMCVYCRKVGGGVGTDLRIHIACYMYCVCVIYVYKYTYMNDTLSLIQ